MRCNVCGSGFFPELTFANWFDPPHRCPECERKYRPVHCLESFPYQGGMVDYLCVFPESNPDPDRENRLYGDMEKCFKIAVYKQSSYGMVLLVGDKEFATANEWLPLLPDHPRVLFLSLFYYNFSVWEDCV